MTTSDYVQAGAAIAGSGVLARVLLWKPDREARLNTMTNRLVDQLQGDVEGLRERMDTLQRDNDNLRALVDELRRLPTRCVSCPLWQHDPMPHPQAGV